VDAEIAKQNTTGEVRVRPRPLVVAPGKPSEWKDYEAKFPSLATSLRTNSEGKMVSMLQFTPVDWRKYVDENDTRRKQASKRAEVGRMALRFFKEYKDATRTEDLPEEQIKKLEKAASEA
jgi:hypothetical protein